jgi:hypothetical protein
MLRISLQQLFEHGDPLFRTAGAEVDLGQRRDTNTSARLLAASP